MARQLQHFYLKMNFGSYLKINPSFFYGNPKKFIKSKLLKELDQCRQDGYVLELGDIQPGVNAIAAPVLDQNTKPVGYISIVGFFTKEVVQRLGPQAADAVKVISKEAGHLMFWQRANNIRKIA